MIYICAHHAQETSIYFATHACKKTEAVVQPLRRLDRTRKITGIDRAANSKSLPKLRICVDSLVKLGKRLMMWIRAAQVHFYGRRA
jgi:hypothetical protein